MGKKSRVKAARKIENEALKEKLAKEQAQKKKTTKLVVTMVTAIVLVLAIVFGTVAAVTGSGVLLRNAVSMYTDNIKVDNAILSYFFYNEYYNTLSVNSAILSQLGLNTSLSLKAQNYSGSLTWFDYIMGHTTSDLSSYLVLAEAAKVEGLELDDEDRKGIDDIIANLEKNAKEVGVSLKKYIEVSYGRGVKEDDVRRALEIAFLYDKKNAEIIDSLEITKDEITKHYDENKNDFNYVDYIGIDVTADMYFGDEVPENASETLKALADKIAAAKTVDEFKAEIRSYYTEAYKNAGEELSAEDLEKRVEAVVNTEYSYYDEDFDKWAFDASRKAGDTTVIVDEEGTHSVYFLTKTAYRLDYTTKNVRNILFKPANYKDDAEAKAAAEAVLATWNAGEKTEAAFEALADEHNEDSASLYEDVAKGMMVSEFEDWIYDAGRKTGDVEIVKTTYGYHIMYFVGDGAAAWEADVEATLKNKRYNEIIKEYEEKHPVTIVEKKLNGVSGQNPSL